MKAIDEKRKNFAQSAKGRSQGANMVSTKYDWLKIKREYITNATESLESLAKKHSIPSTSLKARATKEKWALLKEEIQRKAEISIAQEAENDILEVKKRHVRIAKLMQSVGLKALENYKPKNSRDARDFIIEGIKIEKQALGLDQNKPVPAIVNIVSQEKEIIGKYETMAEEGEIVDG